MAKKGGGRINDFALTKDNSELIKQITENLSSNFL